ncbi:MFS transporter [Sciscionella sediminilitoris]|uniref:MFS transporter n=1 Tax=Sciscionella sediminilitoris TaxID=1445613 RepID=UPI0009EC8093|nr:MFS transporter [Sciscionella sp. SE31]
MTSSTAATVAGSGERRHRRRLALTLALLAFAQLIISIDYNIVFVALPEIGHGLGFTAQTQQWVVSAYAVIFGGFLLLGGRAADLLGRRRMFIAGLVLYAVASLAGGLATSSLLLVAARAVQGLGGALLFPATLSLVNTMFAEGKERNRALAVWSGSGAGGLVLGSLLGGLLTEAFAWQAVFFVNVPLAVIAIGFGFALIARDAPREHGRRFDLPGALTATVGATLLVFALVQGPELGWGSPGVVISAVIAVLLLASFVLIEKRSADPLLPLRLLRNRNLSTGVTITFLFTSTFGSLLYLLTIYFQGAHGYSALEAGVAYLLPMAIVLCGNTLGGRLLTRLGVRLTITCSLAVLAVGAAVLGLGMSATSSYAALIPGLVLFGIGGGVTFTSMFAAAASGVDAAEQGIASGIASTGQQVGTAVGLAVLVAIANARTAGVSAAELPAATADGVRTAVFVAAAGIVVMVLVALNFKRSGATG